MKTLYESILDDEDILMNKMDAKAQVINIYNTWEAHQIFFNQDKNAVEADTNGIRINKPIYNFNDLTMVKDLTDIYYMEYLRIDDNYNGSNPMHIKNINTLEFIETYDVKPDKIINTYVHKLKIDNVKLLRLDLGIIMIRSVKAIIKAIKSICTNIEKLQISGIFDDCDENDKAKVRSALTGLNVDTLSLHCEFFPDVSISHVTTITLLKSLKNSEAFDQLFANNHIKHLQVIDYKSFNQIYYELVPNKRASFGYKKIKQ